MKKDNTDKIIDATIDYTIITLLYLSEESHLPELYNVLGSTALKKLVLHFGGTTIKIPTMEQLKIAVRDAHIYSVLNGKEKNSYLATELAMSYHLTTKEILHIYSRSKKYIEVAKRVAKKITETEKPVWE